MQEAGGAQACIGAGFADAIPSIAGATTLLLLSKLMMVKRWIVCCLNFTCCLSTLHRCKPVQECLTCTAQPRLCSLLYPTGSAVPSHFDLSVELKHHTNLVRSWSSLIVAVLKRNRHMYSLACYEELLMSSEELARKKAHVMLDWEVTELMETVPQEQWGKLPDTNTFLGQLFDYSDKDTARQAIMEEVSKVLLGLPDTEVRIVSYTHTGKWGCIVPRMADAPAG